MARNGSPWNVARRPPSTEYLGLRSQEAIGSRAKTALPHWPIQFEGSVESIYESGQFASHEWLTIAFKNQNGSYVQYLLVGAN